MSEPEITDPRPDETQLYRFIRAVLPALKLVGAGLKVVYYAIRIADELDP
ncbi:MULTISPECIES: hypothetical protein [unclassified Streptomyces]